MAAAAATDVSRRNRSYNEGRRPAVPSSSILTPRQNATRPAMLLAALDGEA
jgi:hypothetical protein